MSQESGAQALRHLREVDVGVIDFAVVHRLAEIGVGGVGGAELNGVCTGPVEAPVMIPMRNSSPRACFSSACFANSVVTALGLPAGVNPLSAMISPFCIRLAASAAVIRL